MEIIPISFMVIRKKTKKSLVSSLLIREIVQNPNRAAGELTTAGSKPETFLARNSFNPRTYLKNGLYFFSSPIVVSGP